MGIAEALLMTKGEIGERIRSLNHSSMPLGSLENWDYSLKTSLNLIVNNLSPMFLVWGKERLLFYNEAYQSLFAQNSPCSTWGRSLQDNADQTIRDILVDIEQVWQCKQSLKREIKQILNHANGCQENLSFTWTYTVIWDETDAISGVWATGDKIERSPCVSAQSQILVNKFWDLQANNTEVEEIEPIIPENINQGEIKFRLLAETIDDVFWVTDYRQRKILYVSPAYKQIWGRSPQEIYRDYTTWLETIHPHDRPRVLAMFDAYHHHSQAEIEYRIIRPDGSVRWIRDRGFAVRDETGQVVQIFGTAQDITEQKEAIKALAQSEARFRRIFDCNMIPMGLWREDGGIFEANDALLNLIGYTREDLKTGQINWINLTPPEYLFLDERALEEITTQGFSNSYEKVYRHKKGQHIPVLIGGAAFADDLHSGVFFALDLTERKRIEAELQESTAILNAINQTSPTLIFVKDLQGRMVMANPSTLEAIGKPATDILGKTDLEFQRNQEDGKQIMANDRLIMQTGQLQVFEETLEVAQGIRTFLSTKSPYRDVDENIIGLIGIAFDITERKQAEASLRKSEERLRLAMEAAQMATWDLDIVTGKVIWSKQHFTILGYEPNPTGEATVEMWYERLHPDDKERVIAEWERSQRENRHYRAEYRIIRADNGKTVWLAGLGSFTYDENGQAIRSMGVFFDITERKQSEKALQKSEARFRIVANNVPSMIWMAAPDGVVIWSSDTWYAYTGIDPDENPSHWGQVIHPDDRSRCWEQWKKVLTQGTNYEIELRNRRYDGQYRWFLTKAVPMRDEDGQITAWFGSTTDIHEKKLNEEALRKSEERLRLAQQAAGAGLWDWDLENNHVTWSEEYYHLYGLDSGIIPSYENWLASIWTDDRERVIQATRNALEQFTNLNIEFRILHPTKGIRWLATVGQTFYNEAGEPQRMTGIALDITDRKQAEIALSDSQTQLEAELFAMKRLQDLSSRLFVTNDLKSALSEILAAAIAILNADMGNIQLYNPEQQTLEIVAHQGFTQEFLDHFQVVEDDHAACGRAMQSGKRIIIEDVQTDPNYIPHRPIAAHSGYRAVQSTPLLSRTGELLGMLSTHFRHPHHPCERELRILDLYARQAIDWIERIRAEEALIASEQRFRNMADNAPVMIWLTDLKGYCTYLSQSWYEFSGQTEETGLGEGWLDVVHPDDRTMVCNQFLATSERHEILRIEYRLRHRNGEYRWVMDTATPWFGANSQFKGYIGSMVDITERKQAEAQQEQLLKREQKAREQAETANRIKDEFLAVLSHELRSPLNPILGWSQLLQSPDLDHQRIQHGLEIIERNAKLQTQLIEDLLDISRILRGKLVLETTAVNLAEVIEAALETVRLAAMAKNITIHKDLGYNIGQVRGNSARLQQIVWNLLSNAVKFTPASGKVEIHLREQHSLCTSQSQFSRTYAQITVTDTGKGINPEFLPHVFEYFRQEDGTTTRKFGGLGLGLAIVRHLVELHGGIVWAESQGEGCGATFNIMLPVMTQTTSPSSKPSPPLLEETLSETHILVVDDEPDVRELLTIILEEAGATVKVAHSAPQALRLIPQFMPNLLICDIGMPDMDGYMLMRHLRTLSPEQGGQIPAIALTAYAGEVDQQLALAAGFQRHLTKPIEPTALVKAIEEVLTQSRE